MTIEIISGSISTKEWDRAVIELVVKFVHQISYMFSLGNPTKLWWGQKIQMPKSLISIYYVAKNKEEGKYQESIQSNTTPDPGHHMEK